MTINILLLLLLLSSTGPTIVPNKMEKNAFNSSNKITSIETEKNIKTHIRKIHQLNERQEKIINTFNYIKNILIQMKLNIWNTLYKRLDLLDIHKK